MKKEQNFDKMSKIIGIISIFTFWLGPIGSIISIIGLDLAILSKNENGKKKTGLVLNSISLGLCILFTIFICLLPFTVETELDSSNSATYGGCKGLTSISELTSISIRTETANIGYIDGKIIYSTLNNGKVEDVETTTESDRINSVIKEVYNNYSQYLQNTDEIENPTWVIEVSTKSGCLYKATGTSESPEWLNELIGKIDVYINEDEQSNQENNEKEFKYSVNFGDEIKLKNKYETYNVEDAFSIVLEGEKDNDEYCKTDDCYRYAATISFNYNQEGRYDLIPSIFQGEQKFIWSDNNLIGSLKVYKVNNVYFLVSYIPKQTDGYFVFVFNDKKEYVANYYDVTFILDEANKKYIIRDYISDGAENEKQSEKQYEILDYGIKEL